jgi:hypothetical protein
MKAPAPNLMLSTVRDLKTKRLGRIEARQNNVYRIAFPEGDSILRLRNEFTQATKP